jgi:AcrR family transcriptional regulator
MSAVAQPLPEPEDPRVTRTRKVVLDAACDLLREGGPAAVTPLQISRRTGISRTTIYRHWPDPVALLREAAAAVESTAPVEQARVSPAYRRTLRTYLEDLVRALDEAAVAEALADLVGTARLDPVADHDLRKLVDEWRDRVSALIDSPHLTDRERESELIFPLLVGPVLFQRLMARGEITEELLDAVLDGIAGARGL